MVLYVSIQVKYFNNYGFKIMQAVILAGGLGKRLMPLTEDVPKSMVSVLGRPYLEYQLRWLKSKGIEDILLLTGYLGEKVQSYFRDGGSLGATITYSQELTPLGTGGSLKFAEEKLESTFLLVYGDSFLPIDFEGLIRGFRDTDKVGMIVVYDSRQYDTGVPNNIRLDKEGFVAEYKKDSRKPFFHYTDAGVSVFKREVVDLIPKERKVSLEEEIFPHLIKKRELMGYISQQPFYDIGTQERIKRLEEFLRLNTVKF